MFIGIDQSITNTGIVFLNSPDNYKSFLVKGKGSKSLDKIIYITRIINDLITKVKSSDTPVECIVLEGGSYDSPGKLFSLGQISGALISILCLSFPQARLIEVPPSSLKKFISGYGNASKETVMKAINKKYNIMFKNDNEADAYALALYGYRLITNVFIHREEAESIQVRQKKITKKRRRYTKSRDQVF